MVIQIFSREHAVPVRTQHEDALGDGGGRRGVQQLRLLKNLDLTRGRALGAPVHDGHANAGKVGVLAVDEEL